MTIRDAISTVDSLKKGNKYSEKEKIKWLSTVDGIIKKETIDAYEGSEKIIFNGYDEKTDPDTELLVEEPFCDLYIFFLLSKIDFYNGDYDKYNNDVMQFNEAKRRFVDWYNRNHMPNGIKNVRWENA